jgi:phosphoribosylglycinamide formyltransferase-1
MNKKVRVAVFISGRGSNLRALMGACAEPSYPAEIVLVISNRKEALGFARAARSGIPCELILEADRGAFARKADNLLERYNVDLIALAGFMKILDYSFVEKWRDKILNIHPSLLPSFPGLHAQRQALVAGVRFAGCTVHFVRPAVDSGPIVAQAIVEVHPDDDETSLSDRILQLEHKVYPGVIRLFAEERLKVVGEKVEVLDWSAREVRAINPDETRVTNISPETPLRKIG